MADSFSCGAAFILEGDTEKVFYLTLLRHFCSKHSGTQLDKHIDPASGEPFYVLTRSNSSKMLIKLFVVGTITQVSHSGSWFVSRCCQPYKSIQWSIFLCYDTDNYLNNISKFYEGDWKALRQTLNRRKTKEIVDLAASADIEDIMLQDSDGVYAFLGLPPAPIPKASKGKTKMKKIFRSKGPGVAYHEGDRAEPLITALDLDRIIAQSPVPLREVERICFIEEVENISVQMSCTF